MKAVIGNIIQLRGRLWKIEKIYSQSFWDGYGWDIEFVDTNGKYHHWKQYDDGGELIQQKKGE